MKGKSLSQNSSLTTYSKGKDLLQKLSILALSARYDNSCSSSGGKRETHPYGIGNSHLSGICHTWSADGRCISLLKILMTNICQNNCKYCICRNKNDIPRAILTPEEIAFITVEFYRRNYIEGLFLSSGVYRDSNYTMELMLKAVEILRFKYNFNGYIHLKILPGSDKELIKKAFLLADRISSNLELPTEVSLKKLAPEKDLRVLLEPLTLIREFYQEKHLKAPASTQLIIGATPDTDKTILSLAHSLYNQKLVRRVYYSAYIPLNQDENLPVIKEPPFLREHRLYQADWLLRFYGFRLDELLEGEENLPLRIDPKLAWALKNLHLFPIDITKASYEELIRIPGIGPLSAKKIIQMRKFSSLTEETLKKLGIPLKKAKYFISIKGKPLCREIKTLSKLISQKQLSLFSDSLISSSLLSFPFSARIQHVDKSSG